MPEATPDSPSIATYRMKPHVRAARWTGDNFDAILPLFRNREFRVMPSRLLVFRTHVGGAAETSAAIGDWIVVSKDKAGGEVFDAMKHEEFKQAFEPAVPSNQLPLPAPITAEVSGLTKRFQGRFETLPPGLYVLFWKTGGSSLAAVGACEDSGRWFAPTAWRWIASDAPEPLLGVASRDWSRVAEAWPITIINQPTIAGG